MDKKISVAMVGGGLNSAIGRVHEIALRMDNKFELVAGYFSRNHDTNIASGLAYGLALDRIYENLAALLQGERGKIQAVVIATPIHFHYEQILRSLEAGFHVISDKPLVETAEQSTTVFDRADALGLKVFCIFNYTGYPMVREMRQIVQNGKIGRVFKVMAEMPQDSYMRLVNQGKADLVQRWRLVDKEVACVTLDLFVHIHSLVGFICEGKVEDVYAKCSSVSGISDGLIDEVDAIISYDSGMTLNAWYGKAALGDRNGLRMRVFGTHGSLEWYQENPEIVRFADQSGEVKVIDRLSVECSVASQPRYQRFKAGHPAGFIEAFTNYYVDIAEEFNHSLASTSALISRETIQEGLSVGARIHNMEQV